MTSADDARKQADLDWLYGSQRPSIDRTREMDDQELAELQRRRARAAHAGAAAAAEGSPTPGPAAPRVKYSEQEVMGATDPRAWQREDLAAPVTPPPTTPRPAPRATAPRPPRIPRGSSSAPSPRPSRRPGGGRDWRRLLVLALVAWLAWLVLVPLVAMTRSRSVDDQPSGERPGDQPGTLTLLVGSDARSGISETDQAELGTGSSAIEGSRTDTMMLLYSPPSGRKVLISLPRDSYVPIPGHGRNKLNSAYGLGGPQLLVETIEQDTGLRVDHYAEVGFDGFANVVDAVGGARVCLDEPIKDHDSHLDLPAGCQTLDGKDALGYVRMRKADPLGDIGRMKRQRQMIGIIAKKVASPMTFINPVRYWRVNMAAATAVRRGSDTPAVALPGIGWSMARVSTGGGLTLAVPLSSTDTTTAAGSSVIWDRERALEMFGQIKQGDTSNLDQFAK